MAEKNIYFDNINTTFPDPEAVKAMLDVLQSHHGNPSSHIHQAGIKAGLILDDARLKVANFLHAAPENIVFTSGATESNNLAISGFLSANQEYQLAVSEIEHYSIINQARRLSQNGINVVFLDVEKSGLLDLANFEKAIKARPTLVSVGLANPEIGTIQDYDSISGICKKHGAIFHCDATSAASSIPIDIQKSGFDLLTLSGHNLYGPMGVGALYIAPKIRISPLWDGGNQEYGIRPGTEDLPGIAAMGEACNQLQGKMTQINEHLTKLGKKLWNGLESKIPFIHFTGHPVKRLPGHVSFWVEHIEGESLLLLLNMNGVMASSGSSCSSNIKGKDENDLVASHVLRAVGVPSDICAGSITFSLGKYNTIDEVEFVISIMPGIVEKLLAMSPSYDDYLKKKELSNG